MDHDNVSKFSSDEEISNESTSDDDEGIIMDTATSSSDHDKVVRDYQVLTPESVLLEMKKITDDVKDIIGYPPTVCRILLHHFKWSKESLLEKYYDMSNDNEDAFFKRMNIVNPKSASKNDECKGECQICFTVRFLFRVQCGHMFCSSCWDSYLTSKIEENQPYIKCPTYKCDIIVNDETAMKLIQKPTAKRKYNILISNSFVENNTLLKWCPAPDCGRVIKVPHAEVRPVKCACGMLFCFNCSFEWHEPVNCDLLRRWAKKCSDDSETSNWLNANTKDCPKCKITIEKDGGCNHMTCKNKSCRFEFCWMCLGPWGPHGSGWYSCNRFDDTSAKQARDAQEKSRAALQRYLHYYNRYMNHQNSLKMEKKLNNHVKAKMELMQQNKDFSWIETQFLKDAVDTLHECRRTLMYTYAFAFYLVPSNNKYMFEDNQADLERATERLSGYLERDLDNEEAEDLNELKRKVQDLYRYVDKRRKDLLKHCDEGSERNEWKFDSDY